MAIAVVNTATTSDYGGTSVTTIDLPATSLTAGNLIVVGGRYYDPSDQGPLVSVTDTAGNTYAQARHVNNVSGRTTLWLWYAQAASGNASNVVRATLPFSAQYFGMVSVQYSGLLTSGALDASQDGTGGSITTITSGAFTTTQANELIVALAQRDATGGTWTPGTGYTNQKEDASAVLMLQDKVVSSIQSGVTADATCASGAVGMAIVVATFKAAGGGGTTWPGYQSPFGWH